MFCLERFFPEWRDLTIHESSPVMRATSLRLAREAKNYTASQFYAGVEPGATQHGFRNENLEKLTFADESIDLHVTQDVLEHVFNPSRVFKEIARTLKPGGAHVFTTPLVNKNQPSVATARLRKDGTIEHLLEKPEYHGNPISAEGSLVTMHWGYDICEHIFRACGIFTRMIFIDALEFGIRAEYIEVLITQKPK
jgi:SAM-dependent methyltransferase